MPDTRLSGQIADPLVGQLVQERYRIHRLLGRGGMGAVYEAEHVLIGRRVALKRLLPDLAGDGVFERFLAEARAAAAIGHRGIIEVFDMGRLDDGSPYMVLELLDGEDYGTLLDREGAQPLERTARLFIQLAEALGAAHEAGVIHRDLKPDNVFVCVGDRVKLLDFGIALVRGDGTERLTRTGTAVGTIRYMSPEQAHGERDLDARADLWSLGVMLYEALAGAMPFVGASIPEVVLQVVQATPIPLSERRPDLPPDVVVLVDRLLRKARDERPEHAREVATTLAPFAKEGPTPSVTLPGPATTGPATAASLAPTRDHVVSMAPTLARAELGPAESPNDAEAPAEAQEETAVETAPASTRWWWLAAALVALAATAAAFALRPGPAPEAATEVLLSVRVEPLAAEVRLDGRTMANPFERMVVAGRPLRLSATLAGHARVDEELTLEVGRARDVVRMLRPLAPDAGTEPDPAPDRGPPARPPEPRRSGDARRRSEPAARGSAGVEEPAPAGRPEAVDVAPVPEPTPEAPRPPAETRASDALLPPL